MASSSPQGVSGRALSPSLFWLRRLRVEISTLLFKVIGRYFSFSISYLLFADDMLLFLNGTQSTIEHRMKLIHDYEFRPAHFP